MLFTCVHTEGGLIPADLLELIAAAWTDARACWEAFPRGLAHVPKGDPATTVTREQWVLSLLRSLGCDAITFRPAPP